MRKAILYFALFALAGSLWAADPIIGTWKLNLSESKTDASKKEHTEVYRALDSGQIELTLTINYLNGSQAVWKYTWPAQGGVAKPVQRPPREGDILEVETLISPGEWILTRMRDGKQYNYVHKTVSKDGKTMRQTTRGQSLRLGSYEGFSVLERQ
jgi:hypothetical protein